HSLDDGNTWTFVGFVNVDGKRYVSQWMAQTGLVWNPNGSKDLDLKDLTNNKFITIGENRDMFVSNDGVNFKSIKMNHPFPKDRLVFASLAKTPFGFHMMTCANWSDRYYTMAVRHLFSKDLVNWYPIESSTFLKNPQFYKGVHLTYDEPSKKLYAISPCGSTKGCSFVAWTEAKDYLDPNTNDQKNEFVPVGEFVFIKDRTAMIIDHQTSNIGEKYKVRFSDGTYDSGYTKDMFVFPLKSYKRQGCINMGKETLCVGDAVYIGSDVASIMGYYNNDPSKIKFAIKFANGKVDSGFTRDMLTLP
ncbi:MAG: hypothetical protein H7177_08375, partial [Rhizobacter sp.]|nr:hypothetical protein [Bacteriovorax sp.]